MTAKFKKCLNYVLDQDYKLKLNKTSLVLFLLIGTPLSMFLEGAFFPFLSIVLTLTGLFILLGVIE